MNAYSENVQLLNDDCLIALKTLADNSVDSVVTDPPYELGFMGKSWDNTGIANNVEMWKECLRVLKPGGHLLAFSGTRTYHRMACAIEDAGFEVRDMIEWVYGSGFPKSLNIGKAVDKLQGNERKVVGVNKNGGMSIDKGMTFRDDNWKPETRDLPITKGTSEWEGWGTALKPAHEPICMARKPLSEKTVAENCLKWGTGGINIDESRVGEDLIPAQKRGNAVNVSFQSGGFTEEHIGRFPANLIHDNSEEVRECFPNESERFFKPIIYQAKASKSERNRGCEGLEEGEVIRQGLAGEHNNPKHKNNHPTVKPIALMEYLIKMVSREGAVILDPFMGSGSTGVACKNLNRDFIGIELDANYIEIAKARIERRK